MTYEIITHAAEDDIIIGRRDDYTEIEQELLAAFRDKEPLEEAVAHGARKFSIYDNDNGVEVRVFEIDRDWNVIDDTIENMAERAVLQQSDLIPDVADIEYEDWLDDVGLDESFVGSETDPGTADLFDAAVRVRARIDLGLIPEPSDTPSPA